MEFEQPSLLAPSGSHDPLTTTNESSPSPMISIETAPSPILPNDYKIGFGLCLGDLINEKPFATRAVPRTPTHTQEDLENALALMNKDEGDLEDEPEDETQKPKKRKRTANPKTDGEPAPKRRTRVKAAPKANGTKAVTFETSKTKAGAVKRGTAKTKAAVSKAAAAKRVTPPKSTISKSTTSRSATPKYTISRPATRSTTPKSALGNSISPKPASKGSTPAGDEGNKCKRSKTAAKE